MAEKKAGSDAGNACGQTGARYLPVRSRGRKVQGKGNQGEVILAGMPLGNYADRSVRLCEVLELADLVAAEDTRRLMRFVREVGVRLRGRVVSCFEQNERTRARELVEGALRGLHVVLVTDAGMPGVSDPGYRLVAEARRARLRVTVVPGPSAVTVALVASGLASDSFVFEGFLPRSKTRLEEKLKALNYEEKTTVCFESPRRLKATVRTMAKVMDSGRRLAICRELTKVHEEVWVQTLGELTARLEGAQEILGEITLVLEGASKEQIQAGQYAVALRQVAELAELKLSLSQAVSFVSKTSGLSKSRLYELALEQKETRASR